MIVSTPNAFSLKSSVDYLTIRSVTRSVNSLEKVDMGLGTEVDHIFNWDPFSLARLFITSGFKIKELDFAGAYLPNIIQRIARLLLRRSLPEPKWLLPVLGRFACQIVFKFSKL